MLTILMIFTALSDVNLFVVGHADARIGLLTEATQEGHSP
jgi:hypothetical protein